MSNYIHRQMFSKSSSILNLHRLVLVLQCVAVCCSVLLCVAVQHKNAQMCIFSSILNLPCTMTIGLTFEKLYQWVWTAILEDEVFVRKYIGAFLCGSVLQSVAGCCRVLQCGALCSNVLQCVAAMSLFANTSASSSSSPTLMCRRVLQCVAVCCSVLQCVAVCCGDVFVRKYIGKFSQLPIFAT